MRRKTHRSLVALIGLAIALPVAQAQAQSGFREITAPPPPAPSSGQQQTAPPPAAKPRPLQEPALSREGADIAGRYVILREGGKDVGCLLTLESGARGPQGSMKAQLAPACRDQGIVIFDPIGWRVERGHLILIARKGHSTRLERHQDGAWWREQKDGAKPLGIRKI